LSVGGIWASHNGGNYDNLLVMDWLPPADEVYTSQSRVLKAVWYKDIDSGIPSLTLRDTYPLANYALETIGEGLKLPKNPDELDVKNLKKYPIKKVIDYCERDVDILVELFKNYFLFMEQFGAKPKWTGGATATALLAAIEPDTKALLESNAIVGFVVDRLLEDHIVRGGLTEITGLGSFPDVTSYDLNSSYPTRYAEGPVPIGFSKTKRDSNACLFYTKWIRKSREIPAHVLGEYQKGFGDCAAWLTREELDYLKQDNAVRNVKIIKALYCAEWANIGVEFAKQLYAIKSNKKSPMAIMGKLFVNAFHGKLASAYSMPLFIGKRRANKLPLNAKSFRDYILLPDGRQYKKYAQWFQQPFAGAYILTRARIAITKPRIELVNRGFQVYYCDTDSIHTNCKPNQFPYQIGHGLGQWKIEREGPGVYVAPKLYEQGKDKDGKPYRRAKGVNKDSVDFDKLCSIANACRRSIAEVGDKTVRASVDKGVTGFKSGILREGKTSRKNFERNVGVVIAGKKIERGRLVYA
jgi:hypothetical protein